MIAYGNYFVSDDGTITNKKGKVIKTFISHWGIRLLCKVSRCESVLHNKS